MDMQPIEPNRQMPATLTVEQWNTVLAVLNEHPMPHRMMRPIIDSLLQQLRRDAMSSRMSTEDVAHGVPDGP